MFRLVVGVLAAFVGFSFGHSIPKWMENNKTKSATESSSSGSAHSVRKLPLRRKSLCKFKFGFQKSGKENLEPDESLQKLNKDVAECDGLLKSSLCISTRVRTEQKRLKFGSQKVMKGKLNHESSLECVNSSQELPLSTKNGGNRSCMHQNASSKIDKGCHLLHDSSVNAGKGHRSLPNLCAESKTGHEILHVADALPVVSKLEEPVFDKISSTQKSTSGLPPVKEKTQMKQWKMKLMSLRTKAMASEKAWYEKFENEKRSPDSLVLSSKGAAKKQAKGKENESPRWSRSSSRLRLLLEGPKTAFER